jgi:hypothetical protein
MAGKCGKAMGRSRSWRSEVCSAAWNPQAPALVNRPAKDGQHAYVRSHAKDDKLGATALQALFEKIGGCGLQPRGKQALGLRDNGNRGDRPCFPYLRCSLDISGRV